MLHQYKTEIILYLMSLLIITRSRLKIYIFKYINKSKLVFFYKQIKLENLILLFKL